MSGSNLHTLTIFLADQIIGTLNFDTHTEQFSLTYHKAWQENGFPLSPQLPLQGNISSAQIAIFLQNLLPENIGLDYLIEYLAVSKNNLFALTKAIGFDTASAVSFLPPNGDFPETNFRQITESELKQRLDTPDTHPLEIWDDKPRLSVAGVQSKLNLFIHEGKYGFGEGRLASTHIVKFEKSHHKHLIINEYVTMKLAKQLNFNVAEVSLIKIDHYRALQVKRFDRLFDENKNRVFRRHIIDTCQALGFPVSKKYERNFGDGRDVKHIRDGVSLQRLFSLSEQCINPAQAKLNMLQWVIFNLCTNNFDAHGKNYSFFVSNKGLTPTPWYDLVNIRLYPQFSQTFAMAIGDEFTQKGIQCYQLALFAEECGIHKRILKNELETITKSLIQQVAIVINSLNDLTEKEHLYLQKYQQNVIDTCHYYLAQVEDILTVEV